MSGELGIQHRHQLITTVVGHIEVDIWGLGPVLAQEPLEPQVPLERVHGADPQQPAHH